MPYQSNAGGGAYDYDIGQEAPKSRGSHMPEEGSMEFGKRNHSPMVSRGEARGRGISPQEDH